ncbi:MAG: disulfide bond formation protein B [Rhodospirillaceae bacterium]|nr:disulfide bond formation protein B [Rhodospirillaceae bacterium]
MVAIRRLPVLIFIASAATLAGAFAFQYIGGLQPCILCLYQRYPHGIAMALLVAALALGTDGRAGRALLFLCGAVFLVGASIAVYHVGVEQHWWLGTASCGTTASPSASIAELRARLLATPVVRCDEAAWSLFGISMAGYNGLISLALAALSGFAAARPDARIA